MSATIVVQFGQGADSNALVRVELDGVENVDADGNERTSFIPGDQPVFLVHHDDTLQICRIECSSGMVQPLGQVVRTREQRLQWSELAAQQLDYLPASDPTIEWYGNNAGLARVGRLLTPAGTVPAVCNCTIPIICHQFRLHPPSLSLADGDEWPVLIVITMEAA